jgi:uncharacterized RDD family membrane protein YckC
MSYDGFFDVAVTIAKILVCSVALLSAIFGGYLHFSRPNYVDYPGHAGFWRRVGAAIIDYALLAFVFAIPSIAAMVIAESTTQSNSDAMLVLGGLMTALVFGGPVGFWIYCAAMESSARQATVGKIVFGLRVVDVDGRRITFARASLRHFSKILSMLSFCFGYYMAGLTRKKQALHDLSAKCLVVRADTKW